MGDREGRSPPGAPAPMIPLTCGPIHASPAIPETSLPVLIPRTRTISVRLSEEEHAALEQFCLDGGARCISELARDAIRSFVSQTDEESALLAGLVENSTQVKELEQKLESLAIEFASLKAGMEQPMPVSAAAAEKRSRNRRKREPAKNRRDR